MRFFSISAVLVSVASSTLGVSLYLVGDSTMAAHKASEGIEGQAVSGRSARSYWREKKWADVQNLLKAGDYVIIEFGHNDGGSPATSDRASVGGEGSETTT
ncbi:hypothetical protein FRC08_016359, partial [Ceratobasidium sp. 394]